MEEPTTSHFLVEKEGMKNFYQSTWCHNQDDSSLYKHRYESLKYQSKAKNATSFSSSVHTIASFPHFLGFLKYE
jgi:hypothetical protein